MRSIRGERVPAYGFNGQIPGPLVVADQGVTVHVRLTNRTPLPTGIHWHGIRLDARSDGVPGVTQDPVASGEEFHYDLRLPDEGTFWYHPHVREDVMQDLGLSGNLIVRPSDEESLYGTVDREEFLILDDLLVGPGGPVPYGREASVHALMGRFGNVPLVNGRDDWTMDAGAGEVVRFHLTNAASTRTFNLSFGELPLKLVASDVGKLPAEVWVESVVLAPAERWVVEVRFPVAGTVPLQSRVQALDPIGARVLPEVLELGTVRVAGGEALERPAFEVLRRAPAVQAELDALLAQADRPPDRTLVLDLRTRDLPFPLDALLLLETYRPPVEWAGTMPEMDWLATGRAVEWILRDPDTNAENADIGWRFRVGDRIRLRIVNDRSAPHAMQHAIHLHGQRFLVLSVDGERHAHPAWKDTVLVPTGAVVDLLVELDNPGPWMLHCHIAEHLESGMMTLIHVDPRR
jgi:FtsP/CotA-like multicopper oxidase with cupredoxin domain